MGILMSHQIEGIPAALQEILQNWVIGFLKSSMLQLLQVMWTLEKTIGINRSFSDLGLLLSATLHGVALAEQI